MSTPEEPKMPTTRGPLKQTLVARVRRSSTDKVEMIVDQSYATPELLQELAGQLPGLYKQLSSFGIDSVDLLIEY